METLTNGLDSNIVEAEGGILDTEKIRLDKVKAVKEQIFCFYNIITDADDHNYLYENEFIQNNLKKYGHLDTNNSITLHIDDYVITAIKDAFNDTYDDDENIIKLTEAEVLYVLNDEEVSDGFEKSMDYLNEYLVDRYNNEQFDEMFNNLEIKFDNFIKEFHNEEFCVTYNDEEFETINKEIFTDEFTDYYGEYLDMDEYIEANYDYSNETIKEEHKQVFEKNKLKIINLINEEYKRYEAFVKRPA